MFIFLDEYLSRGTECAARGLQAVVLGEVRLLLAEWVPFGENSISSMSINLGAMDRLDFVTQYSRVRMYSSLRIFKTCAGIARQE
jgi:hypothetical protein